MPPERQKRGVAGNTSLAITETGAPTVAATAVGQRTEPPQAPVKSAAEKMREKLRTTAGQEVYKMRKAVVEPVFGQIKERRGLRGF